MLKETEDGYVLRQPDNIWVLFDKSGHVERMENCNRRGISFFYNEKKQLTEVVSDNGNRLRYQYNDNGRLVLVTDHTGRKLLWSMRKENLSKLRYLQALSIVINTVKRKNKRTCKCKRSACSMQ